MTVLRTGKGSEKERIVSQPGAGENAIVEPWQVQNMSSSWKKWAVGLTLIIILPFCVVFAAHLVNPVGTARWFVRAGHSWGEHWPLPRGKHFFLRVHNLLYVMRLLQPVTVKVRPGVVMELDSRDIVTSTILLHGIWEPEVTRIVESLQAGAVFIDVGAHVGYYSLLASTRVGATGRVVSVEPNPSTAERLRRNIRLSSAVNVVVQELACTDTEKTLRFFQAGPYNTGGSSLSAKTAASAKEVAVRGLPLDAIVKSLDLRRIDLVKIDVEGAELQVLRGMKESLVKYHPKVVIELIPWILANLGASVHEVSSFLHQTGYVQEHQIDAVDYLWVPTPGPVSSR